MKKKIILGALVMTFISTTLYSTNIAIFCSADDKASDDFKIVAYTLAAELGRHGFGLVTGGSRTGLMKEIVDGYASTSSTLARVYGVLPEVLKKYNVHHLSIPETNLIWVGTMHVRLATFHELSDVVIALPGGFGTLHELMDFLVHNQFAITKKKIILINTNGYWNNLLAQFESMKKEKLLSQTHLDILSIVSDHQECMQLLVENILTMHPITD